MLIRSLKTCDEIVSGDQALLRELLHPGKADMEIRYSLAHAVIRAGQTTRAHVLSTSEVYYILEGTGVMHIGEETASVFPGDAVYIPPNSTQFISNSGNTDLKFLCIVDPAWQPDDEIILAR